MLSRTPFLGHNSVWFGAMTDIVHLYGWTKYETESNHFVYPWPRVTRNAQKKTLSCILRFTKQGCCSEPKDDQTSRMDICCTVVLWLPFSETLSSPLPNKYKQIWGHTLNLSFQKGDPSNITLIWISEMVPHSTRPL